MIITQLSCKFTLMGNSDVYGDGGKRTVPNMNAVYELIMQTTALLFALVQLCLFPL